MVSLKDIFDRPFAGPEMKIKYEAALGRFLVAFNAVEDYMRYTAAEICRSSEKPELWEKLAGDDFTRQLKNLRLLSLAAPYFSNLPFDDLENLNATRNKLAHGHYEQDLFSEEFEIVGKRKRIRMSIAEINAATAEADVLCQQLGSDLQHFIDPEPWNN